jgi:hypothetical protein
MTMDSERAAPTPSGMSLREAKTSTSRAASAFVAFAVGIVAACSSSSSGGATPSNVKCTQDTSADLCMCTTHDRALSDTIVQVPACDTHPSGSTWECCYDRDTSGYTMACQCMVWRCIRFDTGCVCDFSSTVDEYRDRGGATVTTSCTGGACVLREDACECADDAETSFSQGGEPVTSCADRKPSSACGSTQPFSAQSCAGLTWKPPDPPRTGGCIRNGNACGPSKQANGNCCSGYCGENGTCEWK